MQDLTQCLTRALTMRDLHLARSNTCSPTGVVVWTLDAQGKLQAGHIMPQFMTPCIMLTLGTGTLDLYHGASYVQRLATLSPVRICWES